MHNAKILVVGALLALAADALAAPIRVGFFFGNGNTDYTWSTANNTAFNSIGSILAAPLEADLGPELLVSKSPFDTSRYGCPSGTATAGSCRPTELQKQTFISALDSLDVLMLINVTSIENIFTDSLSRARLFDFAKRKGIVGTYYSSRHGSSWPVWNDFIGARFQNYPSADRSATVHLDSSSHNEPTWRFLNRGLPDSVTTVSAWVAFTTDGDVIRSQPGLKVTTNVDESSYAGGMGGARVMGDHPISWYRVHPEGGRFFYTALGKRAQHYAGTGITGSPATNFLRRQLYNAILWAAGVDSTGNVVSVADRNRNAPAGFADHAQLRLGAKSLTVTLRNSGVHTIDILTLNGRRIESRRNAVRGEHPFTNLSPGVHLVSISATAGRYSQLVHIP